MVLRKEERERVDVAKAIASEHNLEIQIKSGGKHNILWIGNKRIPIATSEKGPKWQAAITRIVQEQLITCGG